MGNISKIRIQNTDYAIKDSRVDDKVDKVTSTDNAIVRFDGTSGNIQNSGVTINDSNHLTAAKLITSGGTSSQFVKGNGSLDSNYYFRPGDRILTNDGFASKRELYITKLDNILYSANIRYVVTHKLYDNNGNFIEDLNTNLFDCNYEKASQKVKDGYYAELYIGVVEETELANTSKILATYCSGELLLTFYNNMICSGMTAKLYTSIERGNTPSGWYNLSPTVDTGLSINNYNNIYKINVSPTTYVAAFKIRYDGKTTGNYGASLTQVEWYGTRVGVSQQSVVTKYPIAQDLWGEVTAPKFITRNGASSQFVKGNGTLDSTSYAPKASPALTGIPTAPTAASGTNTTQIATTAFVKSAIADKADSATTLAGYGITDAKIESGVITLGNNTITPLKKLSGTTAERPTDVSVGDCYFDTDLGKDIYVKEVNNNVVTWVDSNGFSAVPTKGTTTNRPDLFEDYDRGFEYFDTNLKTQVYLDYSHEEVVNHTYIYSQTKSAYYSNPFLAGDKLYAHTVKNNSGTNTLTLAFCKTNDGTFEDAIYLDASVVISNTIVDTPIVSAPDPTVYPYIYNAYTQNTNHTIKWIRRNIEWVPSQTTDNLVTSVSSSSTDAQYPSAKCVYDLVGDVETLLASI